MQDHLKLLDNISMMVIDPVTGKKAKIQSKKTIMKLIRIFQMKLFKFGY